MTRPRNYTPYLFLIAVLFLAAALYIQTPSHFFYFDDYDFLNIPLPQTAADWLAPLNLTWTSVDGWYRPLSQFYYFVLFRSAFQLNSAPYLLFSFVLFLLNLVLTFGLVRRLTHQPLTALFSAFLYGVNFIHAETLGWAIGITEIALTFFSLLTLLTYIAWEQQNRRGTPKPILRWLSVGFFLLALGSKETAIVLALWLSAYSLLSQNSSGRFPRTIYQIVRAQLPFYIFTLFYLLIRFPVIRAQTTGDTPYGFRLGANQLSHYLWFVRWTADLFLYPLNLIKDAIAPNLSLGGIAWLTFLALPLVVCGIALIVWRHNHHRGQILLPAHDLRLVLLGIVWFIIGLLPVSLGANQAAYYLVLPAVGAYLALGVVLIALYQWLASRAHTAALVSTFLLAAFIAWGSFHRVSQYETFDMPLRGRIARQTIESLQFLNTGKSDSYAIYFLDFPTNVWRPAWAHPAVQAFYPNVRTQVILPDSPQAVLSPNAITIKVRYRDGQVRAEPNQP